MFKNILLKTGKFFTMLGTAVLVYAVKYKFVLGAVALVAALAVAVAAVMPPKKETAESTSVASQVISEPALVSSETSEVNASSDLYSEVSSQVSSVSTSSAYVSSKKPETPSSKPVFSVKPSVQNTDFKYNCNLDIEDNVFMDSMVYTGYNLAKHRADGRMWEYILASKKRGMGYLSNISYGGGATGYETTSDGKPDLKKFEKGGLVCASYVTYVYFNYLPNIAGIDTSSLPRPAKSDVAHEWWLAGEKWKSLGYSKEIKFNLSVDSSRYIVFKPEESIPIGSLLFFCPVTDLSNMKVNFSRKSHVAIYGGYKNGYNWIYHVGNENGPEMCAVERVLYGPDPQWPVMVITPPSNINFSAVLSAEVRSDDGNPVSGVNITAKYEKTGKEIFIGTTDENGKAEKQGLGYGKYTVKYTLPDGYTADKSEFSAELLTKNNSVYNACIVCNKKQPEALQSDTSSFESSQ